MTMRPLSRTQQALALMETEGLSAYAAAEKVGMKPTALYVALKKQRMKTSGCCPTCGAPTNDAGKYVPRTGT